MEILKLAFCMDQTMHALFFVQTKMLFQVFAFTVVNCSSFIFTNFSYSGGDCLIRCVGCANNEHFSNFNKCAVKFLTPALSWVDIAEFWDHKSTLIWIFRGWVFTEGRICPQILTVWTCEYLQV